MSIGLVVSFFVFVLLLLCIEKYAWSKAPIDEIFKVINLSDPNGVYIVVMNRHVIHRAVAIKIQEALGHYGVRYITILASGKPSDCIAVNPKVKP